MELLPFFIIGFIIAVGLWILCIYLYERPRKGSGAPNDEGTSGSTAPSPPQSYGTVISEPGVYGKRKAQYHEFRSRKKALPAAFWRVSIIVFLAYFVVVVGYLSWSSWPLYLAVLGISLFFALVAFIKKSINRTSMTPLMKAASKGQTQECQRLLSQGAKLNAKSALGDTALLFACARSHFETVRFLLGQGSPVNGLGSDRRAALTVTATQKQSAEQLRIVELLVASGAEVDAMDKYGKTALMYAVENGNTGVVRFLIDHGADVNKAYIKRVRTENDGHYYVHQSVLSFAAPESTEIKEMLMAAGARETADDQIGTI